MLQPTNRITLSDAMRPPIGFSLESAMAVTYTLDLTALLTALTAFTLSGPDVTVSDDGPDEPIDLLSAVRTHSDKLTVFNQVGEIALPPSRRVFAFLDETVVAVRAPLGGVVHPKVWVLRYEASDDTVAGGVPEQRLRVLIASRNLTFDASWDTVIRLDEATGKAGARLGAVGDLFDGLLPMAVGDVAAVHQDRVRSLATALRDARFALPAGVDNLKIHVLGLKPTPSPLPTSADRSLIISPFVSNPFFAKVYPAPVEKLVSRWQSLDTLTPEILATVAEPYVFDDTSTRDLDADEVWSPQDPGRPLAGLHAKVFAFEQGGRAQLFLGSANATGSAFDKNVEILVEFGGSVAKLGIDHLCGGSKDEPRLHDLFKPYHAGKPGGWSDEAMGLDDARHTIAEHPIDGLVEQSGTGWAITYRSEEPFPTFDDVEVHCWPLSSAGNRRRVQQGEPLDLRFEVSTERIIGFLAYELEGEEGTVSRFVVPVPLTGMPEDRDRCLLRSLIGNGERFFRYLLALLAEDSERDQDSEWPELLDAAEPVSADVGDQASQPRRTSSNNPAVLERLLQTMRRDPSKFEGLDPLVFDLDDDILPTGFSELWTTIQEVTNVGGGTK